MVIGPQKSAIHRHKLSGQICCLCVNCFKHNLTGSVELCAWALSHGLGPYQIWLLFESKNMALHKCYPKTWERSGPAPGVGGHGILRKCISFSSLGHLVKFGHCHSLWPFIEWYHRKIWDLVALWRHMMDPLKRASRLVVLSYQVHCISV